MERFTPAVYPAAQQRDQWSSLRGMRLIVGGSADAALTRGIN
jgi:hypothetical protein